MIRAALLIFAVLFVAGCEAVAAPPPGTPFSAAESLLSERPAPAPARLVLTAMIQTGSGPAGARTVALGDDWAADNHDQGTTLHDFRLDRVISIRGDAFTSNSFAGALAFRVMEYQNRFALSRALAGAGLPDPGGSACDSAVELGVVVPIRGYEAPTRSRAEPGGRVFTCDGAPIGRYKISNQPAPRTFWPYLAQTFPMHPDMLAEMRKAGRVPELVEARSGSPARGGGGLRSWRATKVHVAQTPYPLRVGMENRTLDLLPDGLGALAASALGGAAEPRPPSTAAAWDEALPALRRDQGDGAAVLETFAALATYGVGDACPRLANACALMGSLRDVAASEPAINAFAAIAAAEQRGRAADAIPALATARRTPLGEHPVLLASYALALDRGGESMASAARAQGLPADADALHVGALRAYPYNPLYWSDLADAYGARYDWPRAMLLYEVALNLPVPGAQPVSRHPVLRSKTEVFERMTRDFPQFALR